MQKTLEQEFREYKEHHIYEMSVSALIMCEKEGIYNHPLLMDYRDLESELEGDERAYYVMDDLFERAQHGEAKLYYQVYEMCWKKVRNKIKDNMSFRIGVNYDED